MAAGVIEVIHGRLTPPSSKSLTQRYFNLALLGRIPLVVHRPLFADDTRRYLTALEALGFSVAVFNGTTRGGDFVRLTPPGADRSPPPLTEIDCGAGGTMLRFLTAALTAVPGRFRIDGIARLRERPVAPLVEALEPLGGRVTCLGEAGGAPLEIVGGTLRGGATRLDAGASSQYLSALLMAALAAPEPTRIEVDELTSAPYVDLTLDAIAELGGRVETSADGAWAVSPGRLAGGEVTVEADYSAAAYPAAAALLTGGRVELDGLRRRSRQGDRAFLDLLARMGAGLAWSAADGRDVLTVTGGPLVAVDADLSTTPDQVPTLAALAPFAAGTTRIRNVPHLRLKESDRLAAMARELARAGAEVEELDDGLIIPGVWCERAPPTTPVVADSHGDHRIAMAMALVGLRRPNLEIAERGVVSKSYPDFWTDLEALLGS